MIKFLISDFDIKEQKYVVVATLPNGFSGTIKIAMTAPLKDVLQALNMISGAVQAQFAQMWLMNGEVEAVKNGYQEKTETNIQKPAGEKDSITVATSESKG